MTGRMPRQSALKERPDLLKIGNAVRSGKKCLGHTRELLKKGCIVERRYAGAWHLWAMGVGAVIAADFFGWNDIRDRLGLALDFRRKAVA